MQKFVSFVVPVILLICVVFVLGKFMRTAKNPATDDGKNSPEIFYDTNIGVSFSYPKNLATFSPKEMGFRECPDCPGLIHISAEESFGEDLADSVKKSSYAEELSNTTKKIAAGNKTIAGEPAIMLTHPDGEHVYFILHKNWLYRLSIRDLNDSDSAALLDSFKFLP